jgi:predicted negative regulator of RcsB-dependent stress response
MKREFIFPLIVGIILGVLVMIFWQFDSRLNNVNAAMVQLEQASAQNTKTVGQIVDFINNATQKNGTGTGAAATTPSTSK